MKRERELHESNHLIFVLGGAKSFQIVSENGTTICTVPNGPGKWAVYVESRKESTLRHYSGLVGALQYWTELAKE